MNQDYLRFARAVLLWAATTRRITWYLYNHLMKDVTHHANRIFGCEGKEAFRSFRLASRVARRSGKRKHDIRRAYRCSVCGMFHVGTDERFVRRGVLLDKARRADEEERLYA